MTAEKERAVWGIHAGKYGEADDLFLNHGLVALGWEETGDLFSLKKACWKLRFFGKQQRL